MKTLLEKERLLNLGVTGALVILAISGFTSYYLLPHSEPEQVMVLLHAVWGILMGLLLVPYTIVHFRRVIGFRRPGIIASGVGGLLLLVLVTVSGFDMLLFGRRENADWIYQSHLVVAWAVAFILLVHIIGHGLTYPQRRRGEGKLRYPSFRALKTRFVLQLVVACTLGASLMGLNAYTRHENSGKPLVADYEYNYGPNPFRPSQTATETGQFIEERFMDNSASCLKCHADIGKQWQASAHRQAASDKAYETNVKLLAGKKGISATRYCEGCHAPIALLAGALTKGGYHGGMANTAANREGVNCTSCHGIHRLVHTKGVASYEFGLSRPYMFDTSGNPVLAEISRQLVRLKPDQHVHDMHAPVLSQSRYCAACHAQFIDETVNGWGWVKLQDEYTAWLDSPFSGQHELVFSTDRKSRCQDCHMPLTTAADPSADQDGKVRDHRFLAANTMLPLLDADEQQLKQTREFLQSNKITVSIDKPYRHDATLNDMPVQEALRVQAIQPYYFYKGEQADIKVVVANVGVGHDFPGGTIDVNEAWLELKVVDAEGNSVYSSGLKGADDALGEDVYSYRSLPVDRMGDLVWKHDLFNMIGEVSRNVIKAGESDVATYDFSVPYWVKGPLSVTATVRYRKLNPRYAHWSLKEEYQPLPIVDMAWDYLSIPVRTERESY